MQIAEMIFQTRSGSAKLI
ncbi:MAG: hypothetical protein ACLVIX_14595 [Lachnospiraceae bacterium]